MATINCGICKFAKTTNPIYQTKYWSVTIADDQRLLGRCYVTLKRHSGSLSELKESEWADLRKVIKKMEAALRDGFGATMFNWNCYMNNAYKAVPPYPHVHWHLRPRYRDKVKFAGLLFEDKDFGHAPGKEKREVPTRVLNNIGAKIKDNIGKPIDISGFEQPVRLFQDSSPIIVRQLRQDLFDAAPYMPFMLMAQDNLVAFGLYQIGNQNSFISGGIGISDFLPEVIYNVKISYLALLQEFASQAFGFRFTLLLVPSW
jgi:diadenosine tetraphosphate (Ap4A) HIT family hydrolase